MQSSFASLMKEVNMSVVNSSKNTYEVSFIMVLNSPITVT